MSICSFSSALFCSAICRPNCAVSRSFSLALFLSSVCSWRSFSISWTNCVQSFLSRVDSSCALIKSFCSSSFRHVTESARFFHGFVLCNLQNFKFSEKKKNTILKALNPFLCDCIQMLSKMSFSLSSAS